MRKILLIPLLFLFLAFPVKAIAYAPSPFIRLNETQILYWNIYNVNDYGDAALIGYYENKYAGKTFQNFLVWNNTFNASTLINFQYEETNLISKTTYQMEQTPQYYYDIIRCQPQDKGDSWVSFYCLFYHSGGLANNTNVTIYFQSTTGYAIGMNATNFTTTTFTSSLYAWNDLSTLSIDRYFTAFNGSNTLHVWNKEEAFDLSLPTIFYQYFDALALVDPSTDRVFVFTIANHPSYAGYRYLYELKFKKSTGEFLGFDTLFTGNELTTLGGYIEEGYTRLYSFDWTNNRWQIFYMGAITYTSEKGWYVPFADYDTASISLGYPVYNPMGSTTYIINTGLVKDVVRKRWDYTYTTTVKFNFTYGNTSIIDSYIIYDPAGVGPYNYSRLHDLRQFPLGANITVVAWCEVLHPEQCLNYGFSPLNDIYRDFPIILPQNITISMITYISGRPGLATNDYWYHIIVRNYIYVAPPSFYFTEFDVTPSSGYANYTIFTAKFSIVPVNPPYNVTLYKSDMPIWEIIGTTDYTWEVPFTSDVGSYYLQAKAVNSLGQIAYSGIKTIKVVEYVIPPPPTVITPPITIPPVPTYPPWLNLLNIILSPFWIVMLIIVSVSAQIEKKLQAGGIAFIASLIILLFIFAFFTRSIPLWIPIIFLIMAVGYMIFRGRT